MKTTSVDFVHFGARYNFNLDFGGSLGLLGIEDENEVRRSAKANGICVFRDTTPERMALELIFEASDTLSRIGKEALDRANA
jgi:hypothetical protein